MYSIPAYKRILSYITPVLLWKGSGTHNPVLELFLYHNDFQLATEDAVYSDGVRYRPLTLAFALPDRSEIKGLRDVLILGTGLGSAVQILHAKGANPRYTLVDNDEVILNLAKPLLKSHNITYVCADAGQFIIKDSGRYDMLVVDIFRNRSVPSEFTTVHFFGLCHKKLRPGGYFVFNYIAERQPEWDDALNNLRLVFGNVKVINEGINRITVAKV